MKTICIALSMILLAGCRTALPPVVEPPPALISAEPERISIDVSSPKKLSDLTLITRLQDALERAFSSDEYFSFVSRQDVEENMRKAGTQEKPVPQKPGETSEQFETRQFIYSFERIEQGGVDLALTVILTHKSRYDLFMMMMDVESTLEMFRGGSETTMTPGPRHILFDRTDDASLAEVARHSVTLCKNDLMKRPAYPPPVWTAADQTLFFSTQVP